MECQSEWCVVPYEIKARKLNTARVTKRLVISVARAMTPIRRMVVSSESLVVWAGSKGCALESVRRVVEQLCLWHLTA
jgi:hypothetical protein